MSEADETSAEDSETPPAEEPTLTDLMSEIRENNRLIGALHKAVQDTSTQLVHVTEAIDRQGKKTRKMRRAMVAAAHALDLEDVDGELELPTHGNGNGGAAPA